MEVVKSGGEVRRVHIIYFLSCMGHTDHPHLIRVHHLARNGVYLRDVKRWLGELRGKDLPEAFAWSYKRRYKTGFVWQDLLDNDLITPISDNEYVLKGSQVHPTPFETSLIGVKKASMLGEEVPLQVQVTEDKQLIKQLSLTEETQIERFPVPKSNSHRKLSPEICSDMSTLTDDKEPSKVEEDKLEGTGKQNHEKFENYSLHCSLYHNLMNKKSRNHGTKKADVNKTDTPDTSFSTSSSSSSISSSSHSSIKESKSYYSIGASSVFRNLVTCGGLDAEDAIMVSKNSNDKSDNNNAKICKEDKLGGSARILGNFWNQQPQQQYPARKSVDGRSLSNNRKKLGQFLNQTLHKPFGGSIFS